MYVIFSWNFSFKKWFWINYFLDIDYETLEKESDSSNNLNFFCVDLSKLITMKWFEQFYQSIFSDPLTHGFRRRAQSLNFVIRGCQASIDPSDLATRSTGPVIKRRRRDPNNPMSTIKQELSQCNLRQNFSC